MQKKLQLSKALFIFFLFIKASTVFAQTAFTPGNIVVYRIGNGSSPSQTATLPVFLDEYTTEGTLVRSIGMPTLSSGGNNALTDVRVPGFGGLMNLSADGQYLVLIGYKTAPLTQDIHTYTSGQKPRTIALVKYDGTVNTSTALSDISSGGHVTSAISTNGTDIWAVGTTNTGTTGGVRYTTIGSTSSTQLNSTTPTSGFRSLSISSGQMYVTIHSSSPSLGFVGSGLPSNIGQSISNLPGFPVLGKPYQFAFADLDASISGPDVLYVAYEDYGIRKYSLVSGSWTLNGTVGVDDDDYKGLTISAAGTTITLYATRKGNNSINVGGGELVKLIDASGYNGALVGTPTILASTPDDSKAFRGVTLVPQPSIALPVKLIDFMATQNSTTVLLKWSTSSDLNFSHFEIERSVNGIEFGRIGKVLLHPLSETTKHYKFFDITAPSGKVHYRLKMIDINGHFEYSKILTLNLKENISEKVDFHPIPFQYEFFANISLEEKSLVVIRIMDTWGKEVAKSVHGLYSKGKHSIHVPGLDHLSKGLYLVEICFGDNCIFLKAMK